MVKITKVSIIVPVYNVSKYLDRCIQSLLKQTLGDIQIILVNDGSTDDSLSICRYYADKDERIMVVDKPNGGVSSARNAGLQSAIGEYIGFVDPDDWIEPEMYESMYNQMINDQSDICICNYVMEHNGEAILMPLDIENSTLEQREIIDHIILDSIGPNDLNSNSRFIKGRVISIWRLLIKRKLIMDHHLLFPLQLPLMEDVIYCISALLKSRKVSVNQGFFYHYMIDRSDSAVNVYRKNLFEIQSKAFHILNDLIIKENIYDVAENRLNICYVNMAIGNIVNEVHKDNKKNVFQKLINIHSICSDKKLKSIIKSIDIKGYTLRKKSILLAIRHGITIYVFVYYYLLSRIMFLLFKINSRRLRNR